MASNPLNLQASISNTPGIQPLGWSLGGLMFDAWLRLHHNSSLTITQHPVETGAAITDHSFSNPLRFSFEIGMSDSASPVFAAPYGGGSSRSIGAYNALCQMQSNRLPVKLITKYRTYPDVLIESIDAFDDYTTKNTLKVSINLMQIIMVNTTTIFVSATPQVTDQTNSGNVTPHIPQNTDEAIDDLYHVVGPNIVN